METHATTYQDDRTARTRRRRLGASHDASHVTTVSLTTAFPAMNGLCRAPTVSNSKRSINASRERRKQELDEMRRFVRELQGQLDGLQLRRNELLAPHITRDTGALVTIAPVWETLAKRQFQARRKAEAETTRLRTQLAAQAQIANNLLAVIQQARQLDQDAMDLTSIEPSADRQHGVSEQLTRLRILCAQWFVALSWCPRLQTGPMGFFETKVVSDDGAETVLDIYSNQTYPFPVVHVEDAIWTIFQAECAEDDYVYSQNCEASSDTLVGNFTAASYKNDSRGALTGTYVSRRFRNEQGHFLMASNVSASPEGDGDTLAPDNNFVLTEDTWIRVLDARELSRVTTETTDATPALTVLQHVRRSRIRFTHADHGNDDQGATRLQTLVKLHLTLVEEELRWGQQTIESMLMRGVDSASLW